jgi:hypothetical protein
VLVQNWLAYSSAIGNFIHSRSVVTGGGKNLKGSGQ